MGMKTDAIRIGGASGFWGDASIATPQLLATGNLDYIVYDYLAEVTMSIMARARAADPTMGYATDFVSAAMKPNLSKIASQGVKIIANAGGVNPQACADAIRGLIKAQGLDLKVGVVLGDDLIEMKDDYAKAEVKEMFSGTPFPAVESIASINAYLGAFPIARALDLGADIVITGRCVDSAVTLGACIHEFGWERTDFDKLAQASLAGHLIECGPQMTGGNFTDWEEVVDSLPQAGYPIVEISSNGDVICTKPEGSGGMVSVGTVAEQMVYEIGDPQAYTLPDVICDFSTVRLEQVAKDRVSVTGALGHGAPDAYKVSMTYSEGFRAGQVFTMYGRDAERKARKMAENMLARSRQILSLIGLPDFSETSIEIIGADSQFGADRRVQNLREVDVKIAVKHDSFKGAAVLLKESIGLGLACPPGMCFFVGARPKPSPIVRLFSILVPKDQVAIKVDCEGKSEPCQDLFVDVPSKPTPAQIPMVGSANAEDLVAVSLEELAWARSGDKGDKANVGVIARQAEFLPYIANTLTESRVADIFAHFLKGTVDRYYLPGSNALNFLLHDVLGGGGVASIRLDPQGKGYSQLLLAQKVCVPRTLVEKHNLKALN